MAILQTVYQLYAATTIVLQQYYSSTTSYTEHRGVYGTTDTPVLW